MCSTLSDTLLFKNVAYPPPFTPAGNPVIGALSGPGFLHQSTFSITDINK